MILSVQRIWSRLLLLALVVLAVPARAEPPLTVAEKTNYQATSRYADVAAFCQQLAKESPVVRLGELGTSQEGRRLPLLILADPPVATAEEAHRSGKLVVYAQGNIHAGEVDGKEALLMLARDLATAKDRPLLKNLILVFAPIFNADGNERLDKTHRPEQNGPVDGVGIRANAQGLDLNRDFVKLESPEVRALVRFLNQWDPAVVIDCHTTNGSYHRYTITYEGNRCPSGDAALVRFLHDDLLPDAGRRLEKAAGYRSFWYGDFNAGHSQWQTVLPMPRYSTHYVGLRNRLGILSESYSYAPFKDRVLGSQAFVRSICDYLAENKDKVRKLLTEARERTIKAGQTAAPIPVRFQAAALGRPQKILGFVEAKKDGKLSNTGQPKDYEALYMGATETTLALPRPFSYLYPAALTRVTETLQRHGIVVDELREDIDLDVEACKVEKITHLPLFQKHQPLSLEVTLRKESRRVPAGTCVVRTAQPLGSLAAFLLEPQSIDGLTTWNFFDEVLHEKTDYPVLRLPVAVPILTCRIRPLPEDRKHDLPITSASLPNFNGSPISGLTWLDDGLHYLQVKDGRLTKVQALTGRSQPFIDQNKLMASLAALPTIPKATAEGLARSPSPHFNPQRTGILFEHGNDLYFAPLDGSKAVRLTRSPGRKELISFSPDGQFVAFVRDGNLFVVDVATQTERMLTTDGSDLITNGKADWVYFEEIFYRDHRAYWWSPDSSRIAFLHFDDAPVRKFTVLDEVPTRQGVEATPYPKAGQPNPLVKLGIAPVAGADIHWIDLGAYSETASLLIRAGWLPDSQSVYFYVQDRAQTWLDVCTAPREGGSSKRLFRETTRAWVEDPGPPIFLKDGSFLLTSARTGYTHLYRFDKDGKLKNAVTTGPWEVTTGPFQPSPIKRVDEQNGWVYFTGNRDSSIATNLYRVHLDGSGLQRLTMTAGDHRVDVNKTATLFVDSQSGHATPTQVRLCQADGTLARTLDTNPVYSLEEYRRGRYELVQIKTDDGTVLEGSLLRPPNFDPRKRYPVWLMIYGGPHMPTVHDNWGGGRVHDEMLAQMGFVIFHCDPHSASAKGLCSTWTAYRRLGVLELKDLEAAIRWLSARPGIDPGRIGLSGTSYGGFLTAFALTHSQLFAAGIAAAAVTDWHNYDTIYTERFMNTPQENPEGYDATSVVHRPRICTANSC